MKIFQSQNQYLFGKFYHIDHPEGYPSDLYPNSDIYAFHDFYEIEMFTEGFGVHHLNGIDYIVKPGYIYFLFPGDFHCMNLDTSVHYSFWNLKADINTPAAETIGFISHFKRPYCVYTSGETFDFLENEFRMLFDRDRNGGWNDLMIKNSIERIMITIGSSLTDSNIDYLAQNEGAKTIIEYMQTHYAENIRLSDIADVTGKSESYAGIFLKRQTGLSFAALLEQIRLLHVTDYLKNTTLSVKEIASMTGFSSPEYLSKVFRRKYDSTPLEYRKKGNNWTDYF